MQQLPDLPIATPRLVLRPFRRGDVDAVHAYRRLDEVARFLADGPMSREACAEAVQQRTGQVGFVAEGDRVTLALERRGDGALMGEIMLIWQDAAARQAELGYILGPDFQGRGYATEAARAMLELGFGPLAMHRIFARCNTRNIASYALMERLGMRREAHFREVHQVRGVWEDEYIYAVLWNEWSG
jgi:RimJ/RimL family protein N-acetyltransferase